MQVPQLSKSCSTPIFMSQKEWAKRTDRDTQFFDKITECAKLGFFYLEMPEECKSLIPAVVHFANNFYRDTYIQKFNQIVGEAQYYGRGNVQREAIFFEQRYWAEYLPEDVLNLSKKLALINIEILKVIYHWAGFKESDYDKISGEAVSQNGAAYINFSHYRPEKEIKGIGEHKDYGLVTLLFFNKLGLQINNNGEWIDAEPNESRFLIIFGQALEIFINDTQKLIAANHRVTQCFEDRISVALFTQNSMKLPLYQSKAGQLEIYKNNGREFIDECIANSTAYN